MAMNTGDDDVEKEKRAKLTDRLLHIGKDCAAHLEEPFLSGDHETILYDDKGSPHERR
jgi:antitoxin VapB